MGVSNFTVASILVSPATSRKPTGRPVLINTPLKNHLISFITASAKHRRMTYAEISHETDIIASDRTIRRVLHWAGYWRCVAVKKPFLTKATKAKRLAWA